MIWHKELDLEQINQFNANCMPGYLGIEIVSYDDESLTATMPVNEKTHQPFGILHGGANVVLAETVGSVAANMVVDSQQYRCFGQEINANHIRPVASGIITAIARPAHLGRSTQVWEIHIHNDQQKLSCISRLTIAVVAIA